VPTRVLLAEDDRFLRRAAEAMLRKQGFTVLPATDGEEALGLARSERPDLILLDMVMPKLDGLAVLRALKGDAATRHVPVVLLSNLGQEEDVRRCLEAGATAYFIKANLSLDDLVARVRAILNGAAPEKGPLGAAAPPPEPGAPPMDFAVARRYTGGDSDLLAELLASFTKECPRRIRAMRAAVAAGNTEELLREAHNLKGTLRVLGAAAGAALSEQLERMASEGRLDGAADILAALEGQLAAVLRCIADSDPS
jgi:DNA-binding response OmpR family regulator